MKKKHAVILTSSATFFGILLIFGIIELVKNKKAPSSQSQVQTMTLNTDPQLERIQDIVDQYAEAMDDIQRRIKTVDPHDLTADAELAEDFKSASVTLAKQAIAEARKTDPELAEQMELKLRQMLEEDK